MKTFKITVPIFHFNLYVAYRGTIQQAIEHFKKQIRTFTPGHDDTAVDGGFWGCEDHGCIWVNSKESIPHEVQHAVFHLLRHIGVPLTEASEEVYAYLTDWLVREVAHGLR